MSEEDLTHFGVKGQRWGVRRESTTPSTSKESTPVTVTTKPNSSKISTKGGERQTASEDAKRAAMARQKLKKSGANSLNNKEMQDLVTRMNLEQQLTKLTEPQKSQYQKMANNALNQAMSKSMSKIADKAITLLLDQAMNQLKKK